MIGVVLWRDVDAAKAVIWCEDQGDLAFFSASASAGTFDICVGDWVSFELELHVDLRMAVDLRVLAGPPSPELVHDLVATSEMYNETIPSEIRTGVAPEGVADLLPEGAPVARPGSAKDFDQKVSEPTADKRIMIKSDDCLPLARQSPVADAEAQQKMVSSAALALARAQSRTSNLSRAGRGNRKVEARSENNVIAFPDGLKVSCRTA